MIIHFEKSITACGENGVSCAEKLESKLKLLLPEYIQGINGHLSIMHHANGNHEIFFCLYDKGKHESMTEGKLIQQKFTHEKQKKYKGTLPTLSEIKSIFTD